MATSVPAFFTCRILVWCKIVVLSSYLNGAGIFGVNCANWRRKKKSELSENGRVNSSQQQKNRYILFGRLSMSISLSLSLYAISMQTCLCPCTFFSRCQSFGILCSMKFRKHQIYTPNACILEPDSCTHRQSHRMAQSCMHNSKDNCLYI